MDHSQHLAQTHSAPNQPAGGSLNVAVDRLDRALEALEARVRALQSGDPLPEFTGSGTNEEYERVLAELEDARTSNAELAAAATAAHAALGAAAREVRAALAGDTLAGLVNNAGIAVAGPVLELPVGEFRRQLDVNVIGPVIATQAFGPLLGSDPSLKGPKGRVVMISSVAGRNGNPLTSAYAASKHAVEGLSESLRRELMLFGIDVIVVAPGPVKTPIWSKAEDVDISRYKNSPYFPALQKVRDYMLHLGSIGLPAERITEIVHEALTSPHPRVRYQVAPDPMRHLMMAYLPKRMVDKIIARRLDLMPPG